MSILTTSRVIAVAAAGALMLVAYLQHQRLGTQDLAIETMRGQVATGQKNILNLQLGAQQLAKAQAELGHQQGQIQQQWSANEIKWKDLYRDNPKVRVWADTGLPDDIVRLRERAALTGAAAYREYLSHRDAMRAVGHSAGDQRR